MSEWKKVRLGDMCNVKGGKRLPKGSFLQDSSTLHPYIRVRDLSSRMAKINDSYQYINDDIYTYISRYIVDVGDVVISIVGTIGLISIVDTSLDKANLTENCVKLINLKGINNLFLYYFLISKNGQDEIAKGTVGAVQAKLPIKNIQDINISLPPLNEQKRIADILGSLDDKIELNNRINSNLESQAQALFKRWFVDFEFPDVNGNPYKSSGGEFVDSELGAIPKGWKVGGFVNTITSTISGDWGKENLQGNFTKEVYCVRGADIPDVSKGNLGKMPIRYILPKNHLSKKLNVDDIVIEISGGSPTQSTGRVALISNSLLNRYNRDMICTNFCRAIKPRENYSKFIYFYWQYLYDKKTMFSYENGTTGIKNFDMNSFIESEKIFLPTVEIINRFSIIANKFLMLIFNNAIQTEKLTELRNSLLPKLMNDKIKL